MSAHTSAADHRLMQRFFSHKQLLGSFQQLGPLPDSASLVSRAFQIAWPSTLENFLVALVGVVDTIMVGSLGASAIAAVGLTTQPKFIGLAFFLSLNVAISAVVARRKGQEDRTGANRVLIQCMIIVTVMALLVSTLCVVFANELMRLAGSNSDTHEMAVAYFRILMGGMFFNVMSLAINAAQRGCGNTRIALRTNLTSNAVNILLNYLLINGHCGFPAMGVQGAALASVLGTVVAFGMSLASVLHPKKFLYLFSGAGKPLFDRRTLRSITKVGSASLIEQVFLRIGFLTHSILVAKLGTIPFAAHQIGMNVLSLSFSLGQGISFATVALVGESLGQKRPDLAKIYGSICQRLGLVCSMMLALACAPNSRRIFLLFTDQPEVVAYSGMVILMILITVFFQIPQVVFSGCLRGAGDTRYVALVSLISVSFFRPFSGWLFIYAMNLGLTGAWIGLVMDQGLRFLLFMLRFRSGKWVGIDI